MEVPTYGDTKVSTAPLPAARINAEAPIEAFGGGAAAAGVTNAIKGLAGDVLEIAAQERVKAVDTMTQDGYSKIVTEKNRLIYDPKDGAMQKRGKDAFAVPEEYTKRFDDYAAKVENDMPDAEARRMFRRMRMREMADMTGMLDRHVSQEAERFHDETYKGLVSTLTDDAVSNFDQRPGKVKENLAMLKAATDKYADEKGLKGAEAEPARAALWKTVTDKLHVGVLNRMVAMGEPDAARSYFNANKAQISGMDMDALEKEIRKTDVFKQKDNYLSAASLVDKAGPGARPSAVVPGFDALSGEQRAALGRRFSNEQSPTAHHEFYSLSQQEVAGLDRADFETKYWSRFDAEHRRKADTYWNAAVEAQRGGKEDPFKSIRGDKDMIIAALRQHAIVPYSGQLSEDDAKKAQQFEDYVDNKFKLFQHDNKRNPKDEEKQAIIRKAMMDTVYVAKSLSVDPQTVRGVLTPEEEKNAYIPLASVPQADRQALINLARAQGIIKPESAGGPNDGRAAVLLQSRIEKAAAAAAGPNATRALIISIMKGE